MDKYLIEIAGEAITHIALFVVYATISHFAGFEFAVLLGIAGIIGGLITIKREVQK